MSREPWWRDAVVYQIYPRSFADADGDGLGDLRGITAHLDHLAWLGVDALWLGPCFASPQVDHGYDVSDYRAIDPLFGTLADLDELIAAAHARGIRVTLDLVPNHTSDQHPWFRAAVAGGRGSATSPARDRYLFRDGRGPDGNEPPNGWRSVFGGPSWTRVREPDGSPGQWYYHLFAPEQPDLNWRDPAVLAEFEDVLRFWLDRGVDGFRIDVADALIKDDSWADTTDGSPLIPKDEASGVHAIYRALRRVLDAYPGDRMAVVETGAPDDVVALFVRPDEMHLAFSFRFVHAGWSAAALREAIDASLAANALVGAPATWVTDNHDTPRSVTRLAAGTALTGAYVPGTAADDGAAATPGGQGADRGAGPDLGTRRARALALVLLALPGAAYLYNGQELGLPQVEDLPDDALQDPIWERSGRTERGRDGCRIPMPWSGDAPPFGFSPPGTTTWLPMPAAWAPLTVETQRADPSSMLHLYRDALRVRRAERALGAGTLAWSPGADGDTLAFDLAVPGGAVPDLAALDGGLAEGAVVRVVVVLGDDEVGLPPGEVLLSSAPVVDGRLRGPAAAWLRLTGSR